MYFFNLKTSCSKSITVKEGVGTETPEKQGLFYTHTKNYLPWLNKQNKMSIYETRAIKDYINSVVTAPVCSNYKLYKYPKMNE